MKYSKIKFIPLCVFFFLYAPFVRAQNLEQQEQPAIDTLQVYIRNAQYQQAIEYIDRLEPSKDLLYQKALCYRYLNDYSSAVGILIALSEKYSDDIPVKLQLATCYEALALYPKSVDCYNQLLRMDSANIYFRIRKADLLYRSEKYALALEAYNQIDSTYNPNYVARCMAMCYEKLNRTKTAQDYYLKAWEFDERDAFSANSLVKIYVKKEDYLSAYNYSERFIAKDSINLTMNALNAFTHYNLNHFDIAIERFEKCLQRGDSSLLVIRSLGFSYYLTNRDSMAYPLLKQAFAQDTTNVNLLFILGKVNYKLGNYQEAVDCFMKMAEKLIPPNLLLSTLYKELALALEKNEEYRTALNAYERAIAYTSDNKDKMELYYTMAKIMDEDLKDYGSAIVYYKLYRTALANYQYSLKEGE